MQYLITKERNESIIQNILTNLIPLYTVFNNKGKKLVNKQFISMFKYSAGNKKTVA